MVDATMEVVAEECRDGRPRRRRPRRPLARAPQRRRRPRGADLPGLRGRHDGDRRPLARPARRSTRAAIDAHQRRRRARSPPRPTSPTPTPTAPASTSPSPPRWSPTSATRYYRAVWDAGTRAVLADGGALSHHHGVGLNRARFVAEALGPGLRRARGRSRPRSTRTASSTPASSASRPVRRRPALADACGRASPRGVAACALAVAVPAGSLVAQVARRRPRRATTRPAAPASRCVVLVVAGRRLRRLAAAVGRRAGAGRSRHGAGRAPWPSTRRPGHRRSLAPLGRRRATSRGRIVSRRPSAARRGASACGRRPSVGAAAPGRTRP